MPTDDKIRAQLLKRQADIQLAGGAKKIQERHEKGLLTARERLQGLFQENTFQEYGAFIRHCCVSYDMMNKDIPADGVVVGTGLVDGRQVAAFSQDFTVVAGSRIACAMSRSFMSM